MKEELYLCEKCHRELADKHYYKCRDGTRTKLCKKCLTMHVNPFEPKTFVWILKDMDIPYIEGEWNITRDKDYAKNPLKMTGGTVFGKYLAKMKLQQ